ncbi:hypothetical protein C8J56DRAFT_1053625 [Mycena floridula]|nr:hypothetical protein C8J56DRAFT_1053625 [Mycena floridula]
MAEPTRTKPAPLLFNLTCTSLFIIATILVLSLINVGGDSFWAVPAVFALTVLYHATVLVIEYRTPQTPRPYYSTSSAMASILCANVLVALWLGALTVLLLNAVLFASGQRLKRVKVFWVVIAQCILITVETAILLSIVVRSSFERRYGRSRSWR